MNAIAGRTETAALGAALATDWVSTSGIDRMFLRSPAAPPGEDVGLKDAVGQEVKPDVLHRHHRPLLWAHRVMRTHGVPEDHVLVFELAVALDELRQASASRVLVRVVARGVHLIWVVLGDPDV